MKKVLSIVWYKVLPPVFGGQKGIARFNQHLAWHLPLVCLCSRNNEPIGQIPYKIIPELPNSKKQFFNPSTWNKIRSVAKKEQVTHIIIEHPYHGLAAVKARRATGARVIVHSHNIESERFRHAGRNGWFMLRKYEGWVHRNADLSLFKTEKDREYAIRHYRLDKDKCLVVPYGIDEPRAIDKETTLRFIRHKHDIAADQKIFLFAGTLDYAPNADAVENIYREIAPRLTRAGVSYKIIICGRNKFPTYSYLREFYHPDVIMAGEVEDIDHYFTVADAFINPVQFGGGVQTKNIDALAHHCNVVCFESMINDESTALWNKKFTCAPGDWPAFIEQVQIAAHQQTKTPAAFFEKYSWKKIVGDFYQQL